MRLLLALFLLVSTVCCSQQIEALRIEYPKASLDEVISSALYEELSSVSKEGNKTLVAYKGAVATLQAKFAIGIKNKKMLFQEGAELIEFAVISAPKDLEIRCLRLGVQENSPKIVGYKAHIDEDKQFLLEHYKSNTNDEIRKFVKGYVLLSDLFTDAEKQLF